MRVAITARRAPRSGEPHASMADAHWPAGGPHTVYRQPELRIAVADGASETIHSGWWARCLVQDVCAAPARSFRWPEEFVEVAANASVRWPAQHDELLASASQAARWMVERKLGLGPSATLLGLLLRADDPLDTAASRGTWNAAAVGDSCVFHVQDGRPAVSFPYADATQFTSTPELLSAVPTPSAPNVGAVRTAYGSWHAGDRFYLATDALSHWLIQHRDTASGGWPQIETLLRQDQPAFDSWVRDQREQGRLRDDDVTLLRVAVEA